jgi:hypothetical protein
MPSFDTDLVYDEMVSNNRGHDRDHMKSLDDNMDEDTSFRDDAERQVSGLNAFEEPEEKTTWFIWLVISCCAISGLLFGETNVNAMRSLTTLSLCRV